MQPRAEAMLASTMPRQGKGRMKFNDFEEKLQQDLHQYLLSMNEVDNHMPECPDVEERWEQIAQTYLPDGIREFNDYPTASLGWMMYIGMAVAKYWDAELLRTSAVMTTWTSISAKKCFC